MDNKIKVVWICHFSNAEVRNILPLSNMRVNNFIRRLAGKQIHKFNDFAPWVNNLIKLFENFKNVELHIVSPFTGLKYFSHEFKLNGIYYHFYQPNLPIFHVPIPGSLFGKTKLSFVFANYFVKRIIKNVSPDIINLIGTENPYYSITTLGIKNTPVFVSVQTVYSNPDRKLFSNSCLKLNWEIEESIHRKESYFGCTGRMHRDLILKNNPNALVFKMFFPVSKPKQIESNEPKIFDFVFFAGLAKKKGVEDLLVALTIVKKAHPNVTLNIIGKCSSTYMDFLKSKINELNLSGNIIFNEFFKTQIELHQQVVKSRIAVFPIKMDVIPGSLIEAIYLDMPVVAYKTTGTPYLNKDGETILLANIGDIEEFACKMKELLNYPEKSQKLSKDAKAFVEKEFDNETSVKRLILNYYAVINHYRNRTPIPEELLFNTNEFPLY